MAFRKTLAQRLFNISKIASPTISNCRISSPSSFKTLTPSNSAKSFARDPGEDGFFRRFVQKRSIFQPAMPSEFRSLAIGENLIEKLRGMDIAKDRLRLDGLRPPATRSEEITIEDAKKLLKLGQLEMVKSKLREIPRNSVSYDEFVRICVECSNRDQGLDLAKMLDESGTVIVLGSVVFLRPDQVLKAIEGLISTPAAHSSQQRRKELEELERQKADIDRRAVALVRRELWCGLGFFVAQTAGFLRLTFWELSWDVMEPICFYVTSAYFMGGYAFFLRTSREPSFEAFFKSRFEAKQKRLMSLNNFDVKKYNELRKACDTQSSSSSVS